MKNVSNNNFTAACDATISKDVPIIDIITPF